MNTSIKPDTSLYSDVEDKLRALAAALEATKGDDLLEERVFIGDGSWHLANGQAEDIVIRMASGYSYRVKPKPRELWAVYEGDGTWISTFDRGAVAHGDMKMKPGRTVVRFVEAS